MCWYHPKIPVIEWTESLGGSDLKFKSNYPIYYNSPPTLFILLCQWDSLKHPKLDKQCESWPLLDGFALDVKVSYETRWIFHWFSSSSRLLFRSLWVTFAFSMCNKSMRLKLIAYVISSLILLNVSATPCIVTTRIGSRANASTGCPCSGVFCISMRQWGAELCLCNKYRSHCSLIISGKSFCTTFTYSAWVFSHNIDRSKPITTFSISSLHIITAATDVKVFPRPILSATSASGISASQTHLLTINHMAQTWCARSLVPHRPGTEYM